MSAWNNLIRVDQATIEATEAWVRRTAPIIGVYADSKVGKTTWLSKLFGPAIVSRDGKQYNVPARLFAPTFYIDADRGSATIGDLAYDPRFVTLRDFDAHPDKIVEWVGKCLQEAEKAQCGAIVIECVNAVYELELGRAQQANPTRTSFEWARDASPTIRGMFANFRRLKMARTASGTGVPVFISLNVKGQQQGTGAAAHEVLVPNMSPNLRRRFTEATDALIEITRSGSQTRLIAFDSEPNPRHAIRGPTGGACPDLARAIGETNLDPAGMLACWSDHSAKNMPKRPNLTATQTEEKAKPNA